MKLFHPFLFLILFIMCLKLLASLWTCFLTLSCISQSGTINGVVLDKATKQPLSQTLVSLLRQSEGLEKCDTLAYFTTNATGRFTFSQIEPGKYVIACFHKMPPYLTDQPKDLIEKVGRRDEDTIDLKAEQNYKHTFTLQVTCPYKETEHLSYCPKCKLIDKVLPILWGLPATDSLGNLIGRKGNLKDYYLGGCSPDWWCNPTKYCERCNLRF
jgi:hypothetical protein